MQPMYVIAFPELAAEDKAGVETLRAAHDPAGHAMLGAHFTFVFGCEGVAGDVMENAMRSVAAATSPIEFCLSRASLLSEGGSHYVFLCPDQGAAEMTDLHRRLHTGLLARCLDRSRQFTPHLTVCKSPSLQDAREVLERMERGHLRIRGSLRALTLGSAADGTFAIVAHAALGSAG